MYELAAVGMFARLAFASAAADAASELSAEALLARAIASDISTASRPTSILFNT
jgi:hypothetical protein